MTNATKTLTWTNTFHNTEIRVRVKRVMPDVYTMSARQERDGQRALCGNRGCMCGGRSSMNTLEDCAGNHWDYECENEDGSYDLVQRRA